MHDPASLKQIMEVGRCLIAEWGSDPFELYLDVTVAEAQEGNCLPAATFRHDEEGWNIALLTAEIIAEGFPVGRVILPEGMKDIKWGTSAYEDDPDETGNTGTVSDSIDPVLVDTHGRPL